MKLLHISDLHLGKRLNEFNLIEDQKYILNEIIKLVQAHKPGAVLICGDVYDKSQPSAEAVELLDGFLTDLIAAGQPVFLISGNHDSPERLGFASRMLAKNKLFIAGTFSGRLQSYVLQDEYGELAIHLLPFIKPAQVNRFRAEEDKITGYDEAVRSVLEASPIDTGKRNILLAHQFITAGETEPRRSDSENISVGGVDNVDASAFAAFDYVALGHLHGPQHIGRDTVRYSGSPLKYSFSEVNHNKSVTLVDLKEKGKIELEFLHLSPLRELREIKGPLEALLQAGRSESEGREDFIRAIITDEADLYNPLEDLRSVYPNIMALELAKYNKGSNDSSLAGAGGDISHFTPLELFRDFYEEMLDQKLEGSSLELFTEIIEEIGDESK